MVSSVGFLFAFAFLLGALLTAVARRIAPLVGLVDRPDGTRKRHGRSTPRMGGVAIYVSWLVASVSLLPFPANHEAATPPTESFVMFLLVSAALFCLVGLWDDRWGLRPRYKLMGQVAACLPFVVWGHSVSTLTLLGFQLHLGIWGPLFTVAWLIACTNVINLIDGLDGLAGMIGLIATVTLAVLSAMAGRYDVLMLSAAFSGSLAGFLVHNWPPAKIFMGDSGSLTIGFLIGALSIEASLKQATGFTLLVPLALISVPAFDTLMAIFRRKLRGKSMAEADWGHIHHQFQDRGLSKLQTLLAITGLSVIMAAMAVSATLLSRDFVAAVPCCLVFSLLVAKRLFGHKEWSLAVRHVKALHELMLDTMGVVGTRLLLARAEDAEKSERGQLWEQLRNRLERVGVNGVEVALGTGPTKAPVFEEDWSDSQLSPGPAASWKLRYTTSRDDGAIVSVTGSGTAPGDARLPRSDDLFRLFHAICREWPLSEDTAEVAVLPFSAARRVAAEATATNAPAISPAPEEKRVERAA